MAVAGEGPPTVVLPERLDRRLRLGPFPSAREALTFLAFGATGAVLATITSPLVGLATVAGGFALAVVRVDGEGLDRRAVALLRFGLADRHAGASVKVRAPSIPARLGLVTFGPGRYAAVVRARGTPTAYLPPSELARRFERFRELLRSLDGPLVLRASLAPMRAEPVRPAPVPTDRADRPAEDSYAELVRLICRRRQTRRVDVWVAAGRPGADGIAELETKTSSLIDRLAEAGVPASRLRGRALEDATDAGGWR
ncbi:MAG TPA: hypothetical protein VEL82_06800 [Thermoplasmata archaeon]|nr:hypothetical protein [Thermoplasmata archaeon]